MIRVAFLTCSVLAAIGQFLFGALCILRAIADASARSPYPAFAMFTGIFCVATAVTLAVHIRHNLDWWGPA